MTDYVVRKNGYFYRPNACGYTASILEAGRWSKEDADKYAFNCEGAMIVKTYDPKSYELAEHFLQHEPCRDDPELYKKHCDDLAKTIQQAVEDWFVSP